MNKYRRKLKCYYWRIKHLLGSLVCLVKGHKKQLGFNIATDTFTLLQFCPRCSKILDKITSHIQ